MLQAHAFYDGATPVYHFYYGNDLGEESTLLTTFPVAHLGVKAVEGVGQVRHVDLSVPESSLPYWKNRLESFGVEVSEVEFFGERRLEFDRRTISGMQWSEWKMTTAPLGVAGQFPLKI